VKKDSKRAGAKSTGRRPVKRVAPKARAVTKRRTPAGKGARPRVRKKGSRKRGGQKVLSDGCSATVEVVEIAGAEKDEGASSVTCAVAPVGGTKKGRKRAKGGAKPKGQRVSAVTCRAMAAVGHEVRAKLLVKLLEGPATYKALKRVAKQEAGPLYHHISQLRLAGLILPKQRDLYELTRGGRNLILVVLAMSPLVRDRRRRPVDARSR